MTAAALAGFDQLAFTHQGRAHQVYRAGTSPAVIVIHEIPGIHPGMVTFAQRLLQAGYTVYLPSLFGRPGQPASTGAVLRSILQVCVTREFTILADRTSPVATWLRALAASAHRECGGPGVGAIGMCLTGGFALAMAVDPAVLAPGGQPAGPAGPAQRRQAGRCRPGHHRSRPGQGAHAPRPVRARAAVLRRSGLPGRAVPEAAPRAGRWL
jgi:dienelactone hydrolase